MSSPRPPGPSNAGGPRSPQRSVGAPPRPWATPRSKGHHDRRNAIGPLRRTAARRSRGPRGAAQSPPNSQVECAAGHSSCPRAYRSHAPRLRHRSAGAAISTRPRRASTVHTGPCGESSHPRSRGHGPAAPSPRARVPRESPSPSPPVRRGVRWGLHLGDNSRVDDLAFSANSPLGIDRRVSADPAPRVDPRHALRRSPPVIGLQRRNPVPSARGPPRRRASHLRRPSRWPSAPGGRLGLCAAKW